MDNKKWYQKLSSFDFLIIVVLIICVLMIISYFWTFNNKPSEDPQEWGYFGDYFAAVFGLLAFLGVLFTARLSENRAEKAEQESIKREERDQFFKLLELFQTNSLEFIIRNDSDTETYESTIAFEYLKTSINRYLFFDLIKNFIANLDEEKYRSFKDFAKKENIYYNRFYNELFLMIVKSYNNTQISTIEHLEPDNFKLENIQSIENKPLYLAVKNINNQYLYRNYIHTLYRDFKVTLDINTIYTSIINTSSYIFELKGTRLDVFCNSVRAIINNLQQFKSNTETYYSLLISQLSRDQLVLLFIFSFSRFSDKQFVENLLKCKMFYYLDLADLVIFNSVDYREKEVLWNEIKELQKYYIID